MKHWHIHDKLSFALLVVGVILILICFLASCHSSHTKAWDLTEQMHKERGKR